MYFLCCVKVTTYIRFMNVQYILLFSLALERITSPLKLRHREHEPPQYSGSHLNTVAWQKALWEYNVNLYLTLEIIRKTAPHHMFRYSSMPPFPHDNTQSIEGRQLNLTAPVNYELMYSDTSEAGFIFWAVRHSLYNMMQPKYSSGPPSVSSQD